MTDLQELKAELQYCVENGQYGPRTGVALRWAVETVEAIEQDREARRVIAGSEKTEVRT